MKRKVHYHYIHRSRERWQWSSRLNSLFKLLLFWRGWWGARRQRHCCSRAWQVMCWTSNYSKMVMPCGFRGLAIMIGGSLQPASQYDDDLIHYFRSVDTHTSSELDLVPSENRSYFQLLPRKIGLIQMWNVSNIIGYIEHGPYTRTVWYIVSCHRIMNISPHPMKKSLKPVSYILARSWDEKEW